MEGGRPATGWKLASWHAIVVSLFTAGLFYYWFALENRYVVFLYGHWDATPFDPPTRSRYWMSGLVASGAVLVLYAVANWFLGRVAGVRYRIYTPPAWWQVWSLCALPLTSAILAITMTCNQPLLPLATAAVCVATTLSGLALALAAGALAAGRTRHLAWLTLAGAGLVPALLLLRVVELPGEGLASRPTAYSVALGSTLAGAIGLKAITWLYRRRLGVYLKASQVLVAGLCLSYLLMPLTHYLLLTPPKFHYISTSANFFASSWVVQLASFSVAVVLALGMTKRTSPE
jgi:hypothetical protein